MNYETQFADGTIINSYMATGIAEGFEETDEPGDVIRAWSYLIGTKLAYSLQGWFGRNAQVFISEGIISPDGLVDWDEVYERLNP